MLDGFIDTILQDCRTLVRANAYTMQINILKLEGEAYPHPEETQDGVEFVKGYLKKPVIYAADYWSFEQLMDLPSLVQRCLREKRSAAMSYRVRRDGDLIWMRQRILVPRELSPEKPYVWLYNYDLNETDNKLMNAQEAYMFHVYKVIRVNLTTCDFDILKQPSAESGRRREILSGNLAEEWQGDTDNPVYPEDREMFRRHMDIENLRSHFREGNFSYIFFYRRMVGTLYRWVKCKIIPSYRYEPDSMEVYIYVEDAHKELVRFKDIVSGADYKKYYNDAVESIDRGYYENLLVVMDAMTQRYVDFNMIDLQKGVQLCYKGSSAFLDGERKYVRDYAESIRQAKELLGAEEARKLDDVDSVEKIQNLLKDRMTLTVSFELNGFTYRTVIRKLEAQHGIPLRALSYTTISTDHERLLVKTFGNFEVLKPDGNPVRFSRAQSKQLLAYLVDRRGYPITSKDIVIDILEKPETDKNAIKYVSTLVRRAMQDLEAEGFPNIIIKEQKTLRINVEEIDCDLYHVMNGEAYFWNGYHNEYMKEYSWAEETNAELMSMYMH